MKRLVAIAVCGTLAIPALAYAADPAPAATATPVANQTTPKKDRKVCKTIEEKGSRLGGKRVCRSQAEWNEIAAQQRQEIERRLSLGPARPSN
jgi:hypothetical protein